MNKIYGLCGFLLACVGLFMIANGVNQELIISTALSANITNITCTKESVNDFYCVLDVEYMWNGTIRTGQCKNSYSEVPRNLTTINITVNTHGNIIIVTKSIVNFLYVMGAILMILGGSSLAYAYTMNRHRVSYMMLTR
jgi:hypothetical protein